MRLDRIAFFGCGNMGVAMLDGWRAGGMAMAQVDIVKPTDARVPEGARWFASVDQALAAGGPRPDALILGVKPQLLAELAGEAARLAGPDTLIVSLLAGIELATLRQLFGEHRLLRLLPNLAVSIGASPLLLHGAFDAAERAAIERWLAPLGRPEWIEEEGMMPAATALAGSGPAFLYRFIDALAGSAEALGLLPDQAMRLARQMAEGAARLALASEESPAALADKVASKGGSTRAGLDVLDEDGALSEVLRRTLRAARDRNRELARLADR